MRSRVRQLERVTGGGPPLAPGDCPGPPQVILSPFEPPDPDTPPCRLCGAVHVLELVEVVVGPEPEGGS